MKIKSVVIKSQITGLLFLTGAFAALNANAQTIWIKANNTTALTTDGSWTASGIPTAGDITKWDNTVTAANVVQVGAPLSLGKIQITNPGGTVTIWEPTLANTLTLSGVGGVGIDMSAATQNLTFQTNVLTLGASQAWNITNSRTLTLTGTNTIANGANNLTVNGGGTLSVTYPATAGVNAGQGAGGWIINGSTLSCNISLGTANFVNLNNFLGTASSTLTMAGSTMNMNEASSSGTHSQTFASLTLNPGATTFAIVGRGASSQFQTKFSALPTRNGGSTVNFPAVNSSSFVGIGGTAGTTMGYGTYNNNDFVKNGASSAATVAAVTYVNDTWASGNNTTVTTSSSPASGATTGTLRFGQASTITTISSGVSGTPTIVVASAANLTVGAGVSGTGIPANTYITAIAGTTITLSANLTATSSGTLTYGPAASTVTLAGNNVVTTGGILNNFYGGTSAETITGGTLTSGNTTADGFHDLIVINNNPIAGGNLVINSAIVDNGANLVGLTKAGAGTLILGGANTFSGPSYIAGGAVQLNASGAWGGNSALNFAPNGSLTGAAGSFNLNGNNATVGGLAISMPGISPAIQNSNATPATLTVNVASGSQSFSGTIQNGIGGGALSLTKTGNGTQTLGGTLSYSGTTTVGGGTLALNSALTASTNITVNGTLDVTGLVNSTLALASPQTLGGSGTVSGNVLVAGGAHTRPGAIGVTNTITGNLIYAATAKVDFDLNTSATTGPNDRIVLSGTSSVLACSNAVININLMGATLDTTTDYVLFKLTGGSASISGTFNSIPTWLGTVPANSSSYSIITDVVNNNVRLHYVSSTPPTVAGGASPVSVVRNQSVFVSVTNTPGSGTITNNYLDLSLINGSSYVQLYLSGVANVWTNTIVIPAAAPVGSTHVVAYVTDTAPLTSSGNVTLNILATKEVWNGGGSTDNTSENPNWNSGLAPGIVGDALVFDGGTRPTPNMDNSYSVTSLNFPATAGAFTIGTANSSVLTLTGPVTNNSVNAQILNVPVVLVATQTVNTFAGDITISGNVSGGGLTKVGNSILSLTGANTFNGATTINAGAIAINASAALGTSAITLLGGTLSNTASFSLNDKNLTVPTGNTGLLVMGGAGGNTTSKLPNLFGAGSLGVDVQSAGITSASGHFGNAFSACVGFTGTLNVTGIVANAQISAHYNNSGSFDGRLDGATVNLDNVALLGIDNSGGNTAQFGALNLSSTASIINSVVGGSLTCQIGAKNTDSVMDGSVTGNTIITKVGSGNLTLNNSGNSYTGPTRVNAGTLTVNGIISASAITNNTGSFLAGTGTLFSADLEAGSTVSPGVNDYGTLTSSGDWTFNGGTNLVQISTTNVDLITVGGGLNLVSGAVRLVVGNTLTNGTYKLIGYTGTLTGAAGNLTLSGFSQPGQVAVLSDATANEIDLIVAPSGGANLIWASVGAQDNIWNIASSINWSNGASLTSFTPSDHVTFNDSGAGNTTVDVRAIVQPSTTVVSGSQAYVFQSTTGGGKLSGATNSLLVSGTGSLELDIMSDYGGKTTIGSGSTLTVGNGAVSASIGTSNVINNGTLVFNQTNNISVTNISGTGTLTKNGTGTLTLTADNTYSWTTIGSGATLQVGTGGAAGTLGSGSVTNDGKLVYNKTGSFTVANIKTGLANGGEVDFLGAANVTLNNGNTYVNNTVINNGSVTLAAAEAIPSAATVSGSTGWLVLDGSATAAGVLDLSGFNQTVNALSGVNGTFTGRITNSAASPTSTNTLTVLGSGATTYFGTIAENSAGSKIALTVLGANQLELRNANTYSGGTILGNTATLALHNNNGAGVGGILMSNGTTLRMTGAGTGGDPSIFVVQPVTIVDDATVTIASSQIANGFASTVSGSATATNIVGVGAGDTVSFSSTGLKQFQSMLGTVMITNGSSLRWSANTAANGGDSATFEIQGSMSSKAGAVSLGALTGAGTIDGGGTAGAIAYTIGLKNLSTTFSGIIRDGGNGAGGIISLIKSGTGTLTLSGVVTNTGSTTISNGVLALVEPVSLDNSATINLGSSTATLDVSARTDTALNLGVVKSQTLNGIGSITGNLNNQAGSTVKVGLGVLNVSGSATLAGTNILQLNRTNAITHSEIVAASFSISGPLTVQNLGPALQGGDTFQLFNTGVTGFSATNLPTLGSGLIWTNKLAVNGTIAVVATVNTGRTNLISVVNGNNIELSWPADHIGWRLQAQTNTVGVGLSNNWVDVTGTAADNHYTNTINPTKGAVFYRMVYP